jgi:hypothetical protein
VCADGKVYITGNGNDIVTDTCILQSGVKPRTIGIKSSVL